MVHNIVRNLPAPFTANLNILPTSVYYFPGLTAGRLPIEATNYTEIEPPLELPGYAIANMQDFYLTPSPQFIISLFLNVPSIFFSEQDNYHLVTIMDNLRLDLIAYKFYLEVDYWWVIALANDLLDPFNLEVGKILRIPAESLVVNEWLQRPVKKIRDPDAFFFGTI